MKKIKTMLPFWAVIVLICCPLPVIQKYYETDEGKRMFEKRKTQQNNEKIARRININK